MKNYNINPEATETQYKAIKAHLLSGKSITQLEALKLYGCLRLSAVIFEIRKTVKIHTNYVKDSRTGKVFGEYLLQSIWDESQMGSIWDKSK